MEERALNYLVWQNTVTLSLHKVLGKGDVVNAGAHLGRSCKATWLGNTALIVLSELW